MGFWGFGVLGGKSDLERLHWERDVSSLRTSSWVWGLFHGVSLLVVWSCIYSCSSSLIAAGKAFIYLAALSPFAGIVCGIVIGVESITGYINKREKK